MPRKGMLWQLMLPYFLIVILSLSIITWFSSRSLESFYYEQALEDLEAKASLMLPNLITLLENPDNPYDKIDAYCKQAGLVAGDRVTVVLPSGVVVGDSHESPSAMENHGSRQEFLMALRGKVGSEIRLSNTLQQNMLYLAIPIQKNGVVIGAVRTSLSTGLAGDMLNQVVYQIVTVVLIIAALAGVMTMLITRRISRPLEELKLGAERFAQGELQRRLHIPGSEEIGRLAEAMNSMAAQLDDRINTITRQRNEQNAILTSMQEGVIAVDASEQILNMNQTAARLIAADAEFSKGKNIREVIRNSELQKLVSKTLSTRQNVEGEIALNGVGERFIQVHGSILKDSDGRGIGAVVVLNDLTKIKQLENVRREFVANVSHELKTPITSIKGFVETLLDGAVNTPADAERFLGIIGKQADRLGAIIEDLLSLSRIEQDAEKGEIKLESAPLLEVIQAAVQTCLLKANAKSISLKIICDEHLQAQINPQLMEQAIVNLIDNAIKYSENNKTVEISGEASGNGVKISVKDNGCGINQKEIPRLFERFYRVDRARSRDMGGTGLGLAIVKHIVLSHKGTIDVDSTPGFGSTFTINIPTR